MVSLIQGMVILRRWSLRENGHVTEIASLMEGEWLLWRCLSHFYARSRLNWAGTTWANVMLRRWPVYRRENGHVTKMVSLMKGAWQCY